MVVMGFSRGRLFNIWYRKTVTDIQIRGVISRLNLHAMKFSYLPLALLLLGCSTSKTEKAGIVYAGNFELLNKTQLAEKWNAMLAKNGFRNPLASFKIRKQYDGATDETYYYLYAESLDNTTKAATILNREKNYFYTEKNPEFIVCSCLEGTPRLFDHQWVCESQTEEADCTETILAAK